MIFELIKLVLMAWLRCNQGFGEEGATVSTDTWHARWTFGRAGRQVQDPDACGEKIDRFQQKSLNRRAEKVEQYVLETCSSKRGSTRDAKLGLNFEFVKRAYDLLDYLDICLSGCSLPLPPGDDTYSFPLFKVLSLNYGCLVDGPCRHKFRVLTSWPVASRIVLSLVRRLLLTEYSISFS
jgi:hypothetical protein